MTQHGNHGAHGTHGSLKSYVIGFILSIVLTIIPLVIVTEQMLEKTATILTIMAIAVLQFVIQLYFFMHIKEGEKPRYNVHALILGLVIVVTIVAGSLWIMMFNKY